MKPPPSARLITGHPLAKGLVGCWSLSENSGIVANDFSLNDNALSFVGDTAWVYGKFGSALDFPNSADYITRAVAAGDSLYWGTQLSLAFWIKFNTIAVWDTIFASGANHQTSIWLAVSAINNMRLELNDTDHNFDPGLSLGEWFHIFVTLTGTRAQVYINTVNKLDAAWAVAPTNTNLFRVGTDGTVSYDLDAQIDNIMAWNRGFTVPEIVDHYEKTFGMFARRGWPVGFDTGAVPPAAESVFGSLLTEAMFIKYKKGMYSEI